MSRLGRGLLAADQLEYRAASCAIDAFRRGDRAFFFTGLYATADSKSGQQIQRAIRERTLEELNCLSPSSLFQSRRQ